MLKNQLIRHNSSYAPHHTSYLLSKGGKFLKKLWCCVSERVLLGNLVLCTGLVA